jgi:hypothetical protein
VQSEICRISTASRCPRTAAIGRTTARWPKFLNETRKIPGDANNLLTDGNIT